MLTEQSTNLKEGSPYKDVLVARHFYQMWLDNKIPADSIQSNWKVILQVINYARQDLYHRAFVTEVDDTVVRSASVSFLLVFSRIFSQSSTGNTVTSGMPMLGCHIENKDSPGNIRFWHSTT